MQHQQYQQGYSAGPTAQGVNMYPAGYQNQHNPINQPQQMYSSGYGSQPSLPRYASQGSVASGAPQNYQHQHQQQQQQAYGPGYGAPSSPLNPSAHRNSAGGPNTAGSGNGLTPRYSTYGYANGGQGAQGGAHPLSNALYADSTSSPTLAGDVDEKKGLASFPPSSSSSSGDSRSNNSRHNVGGKGAAGGAYKRWSGAHIADSGADQRHVKLERIGWIDGLRFIAACIALNGTFFAATITNESSYSAIQRSSPLYIFRSFGLAVTLFLLILGRALSAPLFDIPAGRASPSDGKFGAAAGPTISFPRLTRAMLTRTFRFILPVLVITALLWALGATNATKDCNQAGMQQPYWNLISRFSGFMTIVFDSFYAFDYRTDIGKLFAGNLWTNAWFFQSSFAVYIVHMMLGNLSSSRYWIYGILGIFMWCTNNFFCVAMIGLVFSDMAAHGQFARIRKWPLPRILILQILLLGLGFALQFINPVRNNLNSAFSTINVTSHDDLTICDLILAVCLFLVFETSAVLQVVFGNIVMRLLGKLAPGIYLLAPAITYTVVPSLGISLRNSGSSGSAVLGVTWVVCFAICVVAAIPFHFLVELPSKLAGEYFADFVEKWGRSKDDIAAPAANGSKVQTKGPQKSAPKKLSGPGAK